MTRREEIADMIVMARYTEPTPLELADAILALPAQEPGAHAEIAQALLNEVAPRGFARLASAAASALMDQAAEIERLKDERDAWTGTSAQFAEAADDESRRANKAEAERDDYKLKLEEAIDERDAARKALGSLVRHRAALTEGK